MTFLLAYGTLGFWLVFSVMSIILWTCLEYEKGVWSTLTVIGAVVAYHFLGGEHVLPWIKAHPLALLEGVGAYFVVGTIWCIVKWWSYVRNQRERYDEAHDAFLLDQSDIADAQGIDEEPKHKQATKWAEYVSQGSYRGQSFTYKPSPKENKKKITLWMAYWPWSLLWTVINDPVKKICKAIYRHITGLLTSISESGFEGTEGHMTSLPPKSKSRR